MPPRFTAVFQTRSSMIVGRVRAILFLLACTTLLAHPAVAQTTCEVGSEPKTVRNYNVYYEDYWCGSYGTIYNGATLEQCQINCDVVDCVMFAFSDSTCEICPNTYVGYSPGWKTYQPTSGTWSTCATTHHHQPRPGLIPRLFHSDFGKPSGKSRL